MEPEARIIYTAGYRGLQPSDFAINLKEAGVDRGIDVRRFRCRAPKGLFYGNSMMLTLAKEGIEYTYFDAKDCLGNYCDTLEEYRHKLSIDLYMCKVVQQIVDEILHTGEVVCFICCEEQPYVKGKVNCHRVFVAEAVAKKLEKMTGESWNIEHL